MANEYISFKLYISESNERRDEIIARMADRGFEGFFEEEECFTAYIRLDELGEEVAKAAGEIGALYECTVETLLIEEQNWNASWEASYDDVVVNERLRIRAPFHPEDKSFTYEIIIEPKMSFGTAHHATTLQMLQLLLDEEVAGREVLDMGSGTAVLAILASLKGAEKVFAIDNDEWAFRNAKENVQRNPGASVEVLLGDAALLKEKHFDLILANINRNILLRDMPSYRSSLRKGARLIMSGFYIDDLEMIRQKAAEIELVLERYVELDRWVAAVFYLTEKTD